MDFQVVLSLLALLGPIILVSSIIFFFVYSQKPVLPGPSVREYLPGGLVFPMFRDFRNAGDVIDNARDIYGEVFALWFGATRVVFTSVPQDVVQVVSSTKEFRRPKGMYCVFNTYAPGGIFTMVGETHRAARRSMRDRFNHSMLQGFHNNMTEATSKLCESLSCAIGKGTVDMWQFFAATTFRIITNVAFGTEMERKEQIELNDAVDMLVNEMLKDFIGYPVRQRLAFLGFRENCNKSIRTIRDMCSSFIEKRLAETAARKESRTLDMLDTILEISNGDANVAVSLTVEFALAGSHTTSQMLTWTIYEVCCNPRIQSKLYDELDTVVGYKPHSEPLTMEDLQRLKYVVQTWKEVLRRRNVVSVLMREATQNVQLRGSGIQLPKGTVVSAHCARCQNDPQIWRNPHEFRPERWEEDGKSEGYRVPPGAYMPFGAGESSCAGKFLADYEGSLVLAEIYRRFRFELACKPEEVKRRSQFVERPQYVHGDVEEGIPIRIHLRQ